jgi:hypothetical protein
MQIKTTDFSLFLLVFILVGCAQVVAPTGGERDVLPPKVVSSSPENGSTNFSKKEFTITFDEYIQLNNISEELMVSPPLNYRPDVSIKGKSMVVEITDTLIENTTYSFNFGSALKDNNEGNELMDFQYAFSTGSQIDSLTVSGLALDAFTIEPTEKMLVMLYANPKDSTPYIELPRYVTKTNKQGEFTINNIKAGEYLIFGLIDQNRNLLFDQPNEVIAFKDQLIQIDSNVNAIKLFTFLENNQLQYIKKASVLKNHLQVVLNQPNENIIVKPIDPSIQLPKYVKEIRTVGDTIDYYFIPQDSLSFEAEVLEDTSILDTITVKIGPIPNEDTLLLLSKPFPSGSHKISQPLFIKFSTPLASIDTALISISSDSIPVTFDLNFTDSSKKEVKVDIAFKEATNYQITTYPGAFSDVYGRTNDSLFTSFTTTEFKDYGNLSVKVIAKNVNENEQLILQLVTERKKLIKSVLAKNEETINFKYLNGGSYHLKVIFDANRNGKWDTGDYLKGLMPEQVALYKGHITIRSNWDKNVEWIITP